MIEPMPATCAGAAFRPSRRAFPRLFIPAPRGNPATLAAMRDSGVDGPALARHLLTGTVPSGFRLQDA